MTGALWVIAVVETVRMVCQYKQLKLIERDVFERREGQTDCAWK